MTSLQKKLSGLESFKRRFFTKSNLSMGIGWLVFLLLVFWASKHGGTETQFFDPYEILQVWKIFSLMLHIEISVLLCIPPILNHGLNMYLC